MPNFTNLQFIGNVHGDEPVGREVLMHLANWLCDNYLKDPLVSKVPLLLSALCSAVDLTTVQPLTIWLCDKQPVVFLSCCLRCIEKET